MAEEKQSRKLDNGIILLKENRHYYVQIGEEKLEISGEDALQILENHDAVFAVVIEARRKYNFNTAMDRYSPLEY